MGFRGKKPSILVTLNGERMPIRDAAARLSVSSNVIRYFVTHHSTSLDGFFTRRTRLPRMVMWLGNPMSFAQIVKATGLTKDEVVTAWRTGTLKNLRPLSRAKRKKPSPSPVWLRKRYETLDKNIPFDKCLLDAGYRSVRQFCCENELSSSQIGSWRNGRMAYESAYKRILPGATIEHEMVNSTGISIPLYKCMEGTGCLEYELFPNVFSQDFYNRVYDGLSKTLPSRVCNDTAVEDNDTRKVLKTVVCSLPERFAVVVSMVCGLGEDGSEHTYDEIASMWNLSRERIRQMFLKGIRLMMHPSRRKLLLELRPGKNVPTNRTATDVCKAFIAMRGW